MHYQGRVQFFIRKRLRYFYEYRFLPFLLQVIVLPNKSTLIYILSFAPIPDALLGIDFLIY
jgi:hypothetical protein